MMSAEKEQGQSVPPENQTPETATTTDTIITSPDMADAAGATVDAVTAEAAYEQAKEALTDQTETVPADVAETIESSNLSADTETQAAIDSAVDPAAGPEAEVENQLTEDVGSGETPRPRPQLNPSAGQNQRAIPSLGDVSEAHLSASQTPYAGPVEIPRDADVDVDLEAQLAAAMGGAEVPAHVTAPKDESTLSSGDRVKGVVQSVHADNIIVDLGYRSSGILAANQFPEGKAPAVGDKLELIIEKVAPTEGLIYVNRTSGPRKIAGNWDAVAVGMTVECTVTKTNKGGLDVTVSGLRAFMPASQVDLGFHKDLEGFVGQKLQAKVTDVKPEKRNLIVSRRALLLEQRQENEASAWSKLEVGQEVLGTVKTLKDYGAFVDLGGVDGLLHVAEITWNRIRHPSDILSEGQQVNVKILGLDPEKKKITLGMKQMLSNPWDNVENKYPKDATVTGKVTKIADFGAFVELEDQVEGMIHISELDHKRVGRVADVLKEGQEVSVKVLEVNKNKKRISLSLKALIEKPKPVERPAPVEEPEVPAPPRKQAANLKGGSSSGTGRGLFGNPGDYR
jgi:predicted RNA-binding protein with RPS1 domain